MRKTTLNSKGCCVRLENACNKYSLSLSCVPGAVPSAKETIANKTGKKNKIKYPVFEGVNSYKAESLTQNSRSRWPQETLQETCHKQEA